MVFSRKIFSSTAVVCVRTLTRFRKAVIPKVPLRLTESRRIPICSMSMDQYTRTAFQRGPVPVLWYCALATFRTVGPSSRPCPARATYDAVNCATIPPNTTPWSLQLPLRSESVCDSCPASFVSRNLHVVADRRSYTLFLVHGRMPCLTTVFCAAVWDRCHKRSAPNGHSTNLFLVQKQYLVSRTFLLSL